MPNGIADHLIVIDLIGWPVSAIKVLKSLYK